MKRKISGFTLSAMLSALSFFGVMVLVPCPLAEAQQKPYRIGVLFPGGPWYETVDALRAGLKEMGLEEGKQFTLEIRDMEGNSKAAAAAKNFEQEKVNVIYALGTSALTAAQPVEAADPTDSDTTAE